MTNAVRVERQGTTGLVERATPAKFNCLTVSAWRAIDEARAAFEADPAIHAILIRAQGKNFCTGADLDEASHAREQRDTLIRFLESGHDALLALEASPLPVVASVQGLCLAGGLELALGADVVFAGRSAQFGDQHSQFGLSPGWGASQRLVRAMGLTAALDLMYSARWLDADTAHAAGLVNYVCSDETLQAQALAYCAKLAERSRASLATMKRLARAGQFMGYAQALRAEIEATADVLVGKDAAEGLAAFRERRQPRFT